MNWLAVGFFASCQDKEVFRITRELHERNDTGLFL